MDVTAKVLIKANPQALLGETQFSPQENADYRRGVIERIRSDSLLIAVLRPPQLGRLNILKGIGDPVEWLKHNLIVALPEDSQILTIALHGSERNKDELILLLTAVVQKLVEHVAITDRQNLMIERDRYLRESNELKEQIERKSKFSGKNNPGNLVEDDRQVLREQRRALIARAEKYDANLKAESRILLIEPPTVAR